MKQVIHSLLRLCPAISNTNIPAGKPLFSTFPNAFRSLLLAIVLCCSAPALLAQPTWTGIISTNWNDPGNWMPAVVPTAADDVIIPNTANDPVIMGSTAAVAQSVTVQSGATLTIQSMASLSIEGDANFAIYNEGSVSNSGTITIGATVSPGFYGIRNFDTFDNETGGTISINLGNIGINNALGTLTNAGTIKIGDVAILNSTGVYNEADFQNLATGILEISRTSGSGFHNLATGTLTNAGTITFGKEAAVNGPGFYNFNEIENQANAVINIDRTSTAIDNRPNTSFTNKGLIVIGANFSVGGAGIYNQAGVTFLNTGGEIRIDRNGSAAIDNRENATFTTTGLIIIGANANAGGLGIYNSGADFTNDGGEIRIDRVFSSGIHNTYSSVFVNPNFIRTPGSFSNLNGGIITIGANMASAISGPGIYNESYDGSVISTFTNAGTISINRAGVGIQNNTYSSFTNAGDITIGDVVMNGNSGPGITNYGTFMHNSGDIQIDNTGSGIYNTNSFTSAGNIIIGSLANITNGPGITNYGTFSNNGGNIDIDRVANNFTSAIYSSGATSIFNNSGTLDIGTLASMAGIGISVESKGTFNNLAAGKITIERTASQGISNNSTFNNAGTIDIGLTTSIGERGILMSFNAVLFKNEGTISIDRATVHGIYHGTGTFENSGTIDIGKTIGIGNYGIYISGFSGTRIFNNLADGEVNIDRANITGLRHDNGTFTNDGTLNLGSIASIGSWGFWNQATFNNNATGVIHVNRTSMTGMINNANTFTNSGEVYIGDLAAVGNHALYNALGATVSNKACALLSIFAPLDNLGTLVQEGLFKVNTLVAHTNTPGFTNNGVIEYFQGNPIPNVTNNDLIADPFSGICDDGILEFGGMNSFTVATTWYQDESLTIPAGTYDPMTNTFTPSGIPAGTTTLYFEVTDDANSCTRTVALQYSPIGVFSISDEEICEGEAPFLQFEASTGTGPYIITFGGGNINPGTTTQTAGNGNPFWTLNTDWYNEGLNTYTITKIEDANGCITTLNEQLALTVNPLPTGTFTISDAEICEGEAPFLQFEATVGTPNFIITFGGGNINPGTTTQTVGNGNPFWTLTTDWYNAGINIYTITQIEDANGCVTMLNEQLTLVVNTPNPGEIAGSQTVCITKDPAPFTSVAPATSPNNPMAIITYQWESSTVNCDTGFTPIDGATAETFDPAQGQFPVTTYFRRRAISTLNEVACNAISNCVTLTVLNVDCGQFPWNGN